MYDPKIKISDARANIEHWFNEFQGCLENGKIEIFNAEQACRGLEYDVREFINALYEHYQETLNRSSNAPVFHDLRTGPGEQA